MDDNSPLGFHRRTILGSAASLPLISAIGTSRDGAFPPERMDAASGLSELQFPEGTIQEALFPYKHSPGFMAQFGNGNPDGGWYAVHEVTEQLRPLHPDCLLFVVKASLSKANNHDFGSWGAGLLTFVLPVPTSVHRGNYLREDEREWYNSLPEAEKYERPDGSPVEDLWDLGGEDFNGNPHTIYGLSVPSPFAPGTVDHHVSSVKPFIRQGYSIVYYDQTNYVSRQGLDFSEWGQSAFRDYLGDLPDERLDELGIDEPSGFDLREYMRSSGLVESDDHPAEDPVFREYFLHQHQRIREFYHEIVEEVMDDEYPVSEVSFHPNLGAGEGLKYAPATAVYTADAFDVAMFESYGRLETVPPAEITDYRYKLFQAAGRFERPPMEFQTGLTADEAEERGVDPDSGPYTTLIQLQAGEAFAHGGRAVPALHSNIHFYPEYNLTRWMDVDGAVPDELVSFVEFVRSNRRFIEDVTPANRTAVVFSLPTVLWNHVPQRGWGPGIDPNEYLDSFIGATSLLREHHIPYDVVIFDQPDLWEASEQLERLASYDTIILPRMEAISSAQTAQLESLLAGDTEVIVSGPLPTKDAMYRDSDRAATLLREHERAAVLETDPTGKYERGESDGESFITAIDRANQRQLDLSVDDTVGVNVLKQPAEDRFIVHLVNYEYDLTEDQTQVISDIEVTIRDPPIDPAGAVYFTKGSREDLDIETTADGITVSIPELPIWGFIVFAADSSTLESGNRSTAETNIQEATAAVDGAQVDNRTVGLGKAEADLSNAQSALEYQAYEQAAVWAERAVENAETAYQMPSIGIDVSHGQPESGTGFETFQSTIDFFPAYEFTRVTEWSPEALNEIDLLLVPPVHQFKSLSYEFTETELDALESFVTDGGSVLVLAQAGVSEDINSLLNRFDFAIDPGREIVLDDAQATATTSPDPLTKMATAVVVSFGTPLESIPDAAKVLARLPQDTDARVNGPSGRGEQGSAADEPVYAVTEHESGRFAVLGAPNTFFHPHETPNVTWNAIHELGRSRQAAPRDTQDSPSRTNTASPGAHQNTSPSDQQSAPQDGEPSSGSSSTPGFGLGTAAAGVTGLAAAIRWLQQREEE